MPPGVGWHYVEAPQDGRIYWGQDGIALAMSGYRYGVIETERELTAAEMAHFDIVAVNAR